MNILQLRAERNFENGSVESEFSHAFPSPNASEVAGAYKNSCIILSGTAKEALLCTHSCISISNVTSHEENDFLMGRCRVW